VGLLSLALPAFLNGCLNPATGIADGGLVEMQGNLQLLGYRLQSLLTSYDATAINHVRLTLFKNQGGQYAPTGASVSVAKGSLSNAINLGALKLATAYRVEADAYSSASESPSTLISDETLSQTDFTTPALASVNSVTSVNDTPLSLVSLHLKLLDQAYAGTSRFTLALSKPVDRSSTTVALTLFGGASTARHTYAIAQVDKQQILTLSNLKMGTAYWLLAEAFDRSGQLRSNHLNSYLTFKTPLVVNGAIETTVNPTPYVVPCQ
jgi:hypothetical protein